MLQLPFLTLLLAGALFSNHGGKSSQSSVEGTAVNMPGDSITFAIIGDFGRGTLQEDSVAKMIGTWNVDFIVTVGDNNYPLGSAATIKDHIGKYYCDYIYNPDAPADWQCHGKAAQEKINRFFPSPGNHDNYSSLKPYIKYFTLPGNERNYEFAWGPAHFYCINSGVGGKLSVASPQGLWLKEKLARDKTPFKFVYFHHPPYSGGAHGSSPKMRWPFHEWGVDAVLCGHEHFYARVIDKQVSTPVYFICGSSGSDEHYSCNEHPLDPARYEFNCDNAHFGSIKVRLTAHKAIFEYYAIEEPRHPMDVYIVNK